jgi:hypothetical protein
VVPPHLWPRRLGASPPDTLAVVHQLRPGRGARSWFAASRSAGFGGRASTAQPRGPSPSASARSLLVGHGARPGIRASVPELLFRPVIVWGNLAPNSSFKPTLLRNAA